MVDWGSLVDYFEDLIFKHFELKILSSSWKCFVTFLIIYDGISSFSIVNWWEISSRCCIQVTVVSDCDIILISSKDRPKIGKAANLFVSIFRHKFFQQIKGKNEWLLVGVTYKVTVNWVPRIVSKSSNGFPKFSSDNGESISNIITFFMEFRSTKVVLRSSV